MPPFKKLDELEAASAADLVSVETAENRQKKSQHPSWLSNTGSNVSNVVPSQ